MSPPIAFRHWLLRNVRPLAVAAGAISMAFCCVTLFLESRQNLARWRSAISAWARSAEILTSKRDIASLDSTTEFLRREYPSLCVAIQERSIQGPVLWSYPENDSRPDPDRWAELRGSFQLNATDLVATARVHWTDVFRTALLAGALFLCLASMALFAFFWMLKHCAQRMIREVERIMRPGDQTEIKEFAELMAARERAEKARVEAESRAALGALAAQVAHDIRSPLAALSAIEPELSLLPEQTRILVRHALSRVQDIAQNLTAQNRDQSAGSCNTTAPCLIQGLAQDLISEKRLQFRAFPGLELSLSQNDAGYGLFASAQATELKRVLSNLINNSAEAIGESGKIIIDIGANAETITLRVLDTGKGIPAAILPLLTEQGRTFGKQGGSGLGLFHAKTSLENWGGKLLILSTEGQGTTVSLSLPRCAPPRWFAPKLALKENLVVMDDDISIHEIWKRRLETLAPGIPRPQLTCFTKTGHFEAWLKAHPSESKTALFLMDHELLDSPAHGLDLIESHRIAERSVLVTSRFEDTAITGRCERLGLQIVPKSLAGFIPIEPQTVPDSWDAVLLDDDPLVHLTWRTAAKAKNKRIRCFQGATDLKQALGDFAPSTPIYIDMNLGGGVPGDQVARDLYHSGFHDLHLATGCEIELSSMAPWLREVRGKEPPW